MNAPNPGWLGYALDGSRRRITLGSLGDRVLVLGRGAGAVASLLGFGAVEADLKLTILDVDGSISNEVRGYYAPVDYRSMLYEAFHLEGESAAHGQLVASAYAAALDLTPEEEAILSAALQKLSAQEDLASPSALFDAVGGTEGFRGFYVDKLKGRVGALRLLDATRADDFAKLAYGGTLVNFASAPYPLAGELAADLFIAKILHLTASTSSGPDAVVVTGAQRLFRDLARPHHAGRLMSQLLEASVRLILAAPIPPLLNEKVLEAMPVRIYSSEAWNAQKEWRRPPALPNTYTICDDRSGASCGFVPRFIRPRSPGVPAASAQPVNASPELTRTILEEIARYDSANRQSIVSYLTPQFLSVDVGAEIDRLHSRGFLLLEPKESGVGPRILSYTVTEAGRRLLRELSG